jgi:hypothetical protein
MQRMFLVGLFAASVGLPMTAQAGFVPAVTFSGGGSSSYSGFALGYDFTIGTSDVVIDSLAVLNIGLAQDRTVRIYQDGSSANLLSVAITAADPTSGSYIYQDIAPFTLLANTSYDIVFEASGQTAAYSNVASITSTPDITVNGGISGSAGTFPTGDSPILTGVGTHGPYFGPTFGVQTVPEPASIAMLGIGSVIVLIGYLRRRAKTGSWTEGQRVHS